MTTTTMIPPRPTVPLPINPMADLPPIQELMTNPNPGRPRIAPVRSTMIQSTRLRDPRLAQKSSSHSHPPIQIIASNPTKSLPRIPKLSQQSSSKRDSEKDRDTRDRKEDSKSSKSSRSSSRDKSKSSSSSSRSSERSSKSKSSDKKHDDDRKSSHKSHRSSSRSSRSKSPSAEMKETSQRPDSTTGVNKDKLLTELLNGEEHNKASQLTISSSENGKQTKSILVDKKVCDKVKSDLKWNIMTCDFKLNLQFLFILRI